MTLYELVGDYRNLMDIAGDIEADDQAFLDTLDGVVGAIEVKADGYAKVMKGLEGNEAALDAEIKRLTEKRNVLKNRREAIKKHLYDGMKALEINKIETELFRFSIQKNGGVAPLEITGDVPQQFKKVIIENDNAKIREYLKDNTCDWAHLGERGESLRIK